MEKDLDRMVATMNRLEGKEIGLLYNESVGQSPSRGNKKCNCPKHEPTAYTRTVPFPKKL